MKMIYKLAAAFALAALPATPALAGWKLVPNSAAVAVAKSKLTVTPGEDWNRGTARPIKKSEIWTLDGVALNELYFVSGLINGETLYRDANKKDSPLPRFASSMQLADIPDFVESSQRIALNTSMFRITGSEAVQFAGRPGVKFAYEYAVEGNSLVRKGIAAGTIVDGQLHLISFTAPATYYFDRDRAKAEAIMASARF